MYRLLTAVPGSKLRHAICTAAIATCLHGGGTALGQCTGHWDPNIGVPGFDGDINASVKLPNGDVVVGGAFSSADGVPAVGVARWNGSNWSAVGDGPGGNIYSLAALPDGSIAAGGGDVMVWNGADWAQLGHGIVNAVESLLPTQDGQLIAGGVFTSISGVPAGNIARWDGAHWNALGSGTNGSVLSLQQLQDGSIVAGGLFTTAGGLNANHVARWDGSAWQPMGDGLSEFGVRALALAPDGSVLAAPLYSGTVARWDGTSWSTLGGVLSAGVFALRVMSDGSVIAGTDNSPGVYRWNGGVWTGIPGGSWEQGEVRALEEMPAGGVFAAGSFTGPGNRVAWYLPTSPPPQITLQPHDASMCIGESAQTSIQATAFQPMTFTWQIETDPGTWMLVSNANTVLPCGGWARHSGGTFWLGPCRGRNQYRVRCLVSTVCGTATTDPATLTVNSADFDGDGDQGTDSDIEAFFRCLAGDCCPGCGTMNFDGFGGAGDDHDIEAFFMVLAGGECY